MSGVLFKQKKGTHTKKSPEAPSSFFITLDAKEEVAQSEIKIWRKQQSCIGMQTSEESTLTLKQTMTQQSTSLRLRKSAVFNFPETKAWRGPLVLLDFDGTLLVGNLKAVMDGVLKFLLTGSVEEIDIFIDKLIHAKHLPEQSCLKLRQLLQEHFHSQKLYSSFSPEEKSIFQCGIATLFPPLNYTPLRGSEEKAYTVVEVIDHVLDQHGMVMILTLNPYLQTIKPVLKTWGLSPERTQQVYVLCLSSGEAQPTADPTVIFVQPVVTKDEILDKNILIQKSIEISEKIYGKNITKNEILYADDNALFRNAARRQDFVVVIEGNYEQGEHLMQIEKRLRALKDVRRRDSGEAHVIPLPSFDSAQQEVTLSATGDLLLELRPQKNSVDTGSAPSSLCGTPETPQLQTLDFFDQNEEEVLILKPKQKVPPRSFTDSPKKWKKRLTVLTVFRSFNGFPLSKQSEPLISSKEIGFIPLSLQETPEAPQLRTLDFLVQEEDVSLDCASEQKTVLFSCPDSFSKSEVELTSPKTSGFSGGFFSSEVAVPKTAVSDKDRFLQPQMEEGRIKAKSPAVAALTEQTEDSYVKILAEIPMKGIVPDLSSTLHAALTKHQRGVARLEDEGLAFVDPIRAVITHKESESQMPMTRNTETVVSTPAIGRCCLIL